MIYTVTLNPALDKTVEIPSLTVDGVNRITAMRTKAGRKKCSRRDPGRRHRPCDPGISGGYGTEHMVSVCRGRDPDKYENQRPGKSHEHRY